MVSKRALKIARLIALAMKTERAVDRASVEEVWKEQPSGEVQETIYSLIKGARAGVSKEIDADIQELKDMGLSDEEISHLVSYWISYFKKEEEVSRSLFASAVHSWCETEILLLADETEILLLADIVSVKPGHWEEEAKKWPNSFSLWKNFLQNLRLRVPEKKDQRRILEKLRPVLSQVVEDAIAREMSSFGSQGGNNA